MINTKYIPTELMHTTSHYDQKKADRAVNFIEQLAHTKGRWYGRPFKLMGWQEKIVRDIFGTIKENGYRQFNTAYVEIPKKNGKALDINTPIPTPDGWKLMKDIKVGDLVFDGDGKQCKVVATTEIMYGHRCYEIEFVNGEKIIADADHRWFVNAWQDSTNKNGHKRNKSNDRYNRGFTLVKTTEEMSKRVKINKGTTNNYSITINQALNCKKKDLLVPPYTLGAWLGDGSSYNAAITQDERDEEIFDFIRAEGVPARKGALNTGSKSAYRYSLAKAYRNGKHEDCIQIRLKTLGVMKNKHIPEVYLRASIDQRLELLRGLMDTDGTCNKNGECEFSTKYEKLANGMMELLISLGIKPRLRKNDAKLYGKLCGHRYRINFHVDKEHTCFHLKRKHERLKDEIKNTRSGVIHIKSIKEVESVPVKCIQVDSESHLYLCGKSMIPTHNSELAAAVALYLLCADHEQRAEIYGAAADRQQASIVFDVAADMVRFNSDLSQRCKILTANKRILYLPTNSFYQVLSAEAYSKQGFNIHGVVFDEFFAQPNRKLYDVLTKGSGDARLQPLFFLITTAGDNVNSICYEIHQKAKDILEGRKIDHTFYPVIYGIDESNDWTDEKVWMKANPSLGETITIDKVRDAFNSAKQNPAEENTFRQLRLNQWVKQSVRWMPMLKWDKCNFNVDKEKLKGRTCYGGLDLSSTTDISAFVLVFPPIDEDDKYQVLPFFWIPDENVSLRVNRDHVPYDVWKAKGFLETTEGNVIHYDFIEKFIDDLGKIYNIKNICFDRWGAVQMSQNLEGLGFEVIPFGQGFKDMSPATKELMNLVLEEKIAHGGHPVLRWMMDNIFVRQDPAGNIKPDKEKSTERIDGAVALIMALDRAIRCKADNMGSVYDKRGILVL